jgi:hypothetical protein
MLLGYAKERWCQSQGAEWRNRARSSPPENAVDAISTRRYSVIAFSNRS